MKVIESIMKNCPCYKSYEKINVRGLMLHSVGCPQPSAKVWVRIFGASSYGRASVHGFIDANSGDFYHTLPYNINGWHAGGSANHSHIGIEMCESAYIRYSGNAVRMTNKAKAQADCKRAYESAVQVFAMLCKKYNLNPTKRGVIVSHNEGNDLGIASNHGDPEHYWRGCGMGYSMDGFRKDVANAMVGYTSETIAPVKQNQATTSKSYVPKEIRTDGWWGKDTTRLAQYVFGTGIDGIVSNQPYSNYKVLSHCEDSSWDFKDNYEDYKAGSNLIRAIQRKVNEKQDGWCGSKTIKGIQRLVNEKQDGSCGAKTVTAFQKWLNAQLKAKQAKSKK